jgi:pyrroloquinoline quinone biosynthesis protein D
VFEDEEGRPSEVAERIVALVDGRRSVREIAAALSLEFDVGEADCARDTVRFVQRLVDQQLLTLNARKG